MEDFQRKGWKGVALLDPEKGIPVKLVFLPSRQPWIPQLEIIRLAQAPNRVPVLCRRAGGLRDKTWRPLHSSRVNPRVDRLGRKLHLEYANPSPSPGSDLSLFPDCTRKELTLDMEIYICSLSLLLLQSFNLLTRVLLFMGTHLRQFENTLRTQGHHSQLNMQIFLPQATFVLGPSWGYVDEGSQIKEFCLCCKEIYNPMEDEGGNTNIKK